MRALLVGIRSLVFNWVGGMSTAFGLGLSILGWFVIPDNNQLKPYIKAVGVLALVWAAFRGWSIEHNDLETEKNRNNSPERKLTILGNFLSSFAVQPHRGTLRPEGASQTQ